LSDRLTLETHDLKDEPAAAAQYGITRAPGLAVLGERDYGIRLYGLPAGYEFTSLIETLLAVGKRQHGLSEPLLKELAKVDRPVHLQVMVTVECPFCPRAVVAAHRLAMASENIRSDMVEVTEYPELAEQYEIQGVPVTIINETHQAVGALPPAQLIAAILEALAHPDGANGHVHEHEHHHHEHDHDHEHAPASDSRN
jgi:glutaredoxin-like protein